jgi:hypothetical protein
MFSVRATPVHLGSWAVRRGVAGLGATLALALLGPVATSSAHAVAAPALVPPVTLTTAPLNAVPRLAVNDKGDAVAVWARSTPDGGVVEVATRSRSAGWSAPVTLGGPSFFSPTPQVAVNARGEAVVVWDQWSGPTSAEHAVYAASRERRGAWSDPARLSADAGAGSVFPQVAIADRGEAVAVWARSNGSSHVVQAATRSRGGGWTEPADLTPADANAVVPHVAIRANGDAVAVWHRSTAGGSVVQVATRPAGGAWSQPIDLSGRDAFNERPQVALNDRGDAVVAWERHSPSAPDAIQARIRPARGPWSPIADVSRAGPLESLSGVDLALNDRRQAVAVWSHLFFRPEPFPPRSFSTVQAARFERDRWSRAVDLTPLEGDVGGPQVAISAKGDAVAGWWRPLGEDSVIQLIAGDASGAWSRVVTVTEPDKAAFDPQIAVGRKGDPAALWYEFGPDGSDVKAAIPR